MNETLIIELFKEKYGIDAATDVYTVENYYNFLKYDLNLNIGFVSFWITYKHERIENASQLQRLLLNERTD